jgi:nucleoside phosphorylase
MKENVCGNRGEKSAMSLVYIFAASTMEVDPVRKIAAATDSRSPVRCGANDVVFIVSGMGPVNAENKAKAALLAGMESSVASMPDAVLVIGLCGGLTESLPEGRLVAYTACRSTDSAKPLLSCTESAVDSVVTLLNSSGMVCDRAVGITSSRIAINREERRALAQSGAGIVDMESYSILETAAAAGIPATVLRVVSDSMDRVLPDLNRALDAVGGLDGRKSLRVALGSPIRTARLLAANKRAMQHLTKAMEVVLKAPCFVSSASL